MSNGNQVGSFSHHEPQVAALPCDALWGPVGVSYVAVVDAHIRTLRYIYSFILSFVLSIQGFRKLGSSWDLFVLRTRNLCKRGVMIR